MNKQTVMVLAVSVVAFAQVIYVAQASWADGMVEEPGKVRTGTAAAAGAGAVSAHGGQAIRSSSAAQSTTTKPLSEFELGRYQYCGSDLDCVATTNGCCDCANGGQDVAVNKERLAAFKKNFQCLNAVCGNKEPDIACGIGVVSCVNHTCRYHADSDATR